MNSPTSFPEGHYPMSSKQPPAQLQLGTWIDGGALELVEVLGVGGYGTVYRAENTCSPNPQSYAVKCLLNPQAQLSLRRQLHIREIALHQISSAHPGVVTLHRVVEDSDYTYIIMDYAPDHDLFTQILNNHRYLGNDALIKHVFLQLLDAVEYCHSLGIYHRDLKPENILCFEDGYRVAITDFGLATTEKLSEELRTGSIYHMSPECQGGEFAPDGNYSPMFNDVWSLGIILLNLATGRNPWRTATEDDQTFQAYLQNPLSFFPSVLPISMEINDILVRMLHVDWTERMTLRELRQEMEDVSSFYAPDVVFEGSQARCMWEVGMALESADEEPSQCKVPFEGPKSHWSAESRSDIDVMGQPQSVDAHGRLRKGRAFGFQTLSGSDNVSSDMNVDRHSSQSSSNSSYFSYSTSPSTPDSADEFAKNARSTDVVMDATFDKQWQYTKNRSTFSSGSSLEMGSKCEENSYSSSFFLASPAPSSHEVHDPRPAYQDKNTTPGWVYSARQLSSSLSASSDSSIVSCEISFTRSMTPSPDPFAWSECASDIRPSVYTSKEFHGSKSITFNDFIPRTSRISSGFSNEEPTSLQVEREDSVDSWSSYMSSFPQPPPTQPWFSASHTEVRWRSSQIGSARSRYSSWFSTGKLFSSSVPT